MRLLHINCYDPFNPNEVVPEFTADVGLKKGEKVDYAVLSQGQPIILIECKCIGASLDRHSSQLYRYFNTTPARLAVLTDGVRYRVYSDLREPNKLDESPFLDVDLANLRDDAVDGLTKLTKTAFDLESVLESAAELKYLRELRDQFERQIQNPTDDFVRVFADRIHGGRMTQGVLDKFRKLVKTSWSAYIAELVDRRLKNALSKNQEKTAETEDEQATESAEPDTGDSKGVETTVEELQGLYIVKAILRDLVEPSRVHLRDSKSYCAIILDDNNRKPICRLHFNRSKKYLGIFDANKTETRLSVESAEDIFRHAESVRASLQHVV